MIVLGINAGKTKKGRPLNDGGACIVRDGQVVCAIQEERLTRNKYEGGFEQSIHYVCEGANISLNDIDKVVVSSCIDEKWSVNDAMRVLKLKEKYGFSKAQVEVLGHHLSHAYCGFISSGFSQALVCVVDNTGNKLSKEKRDEWDAAFERSTYYKGSWKAGRPVMELLEQDANTNKTIGYGEAYRYFTHFFGWDSYKHAGKTMGLAPYGNPRVFAHLRLFETKGYEEVCLLGAKHAEPEYELRTFFEQHGVRLPRKLYKNEAVTQYYADMAYFLQKEFERSITKKVSHLITTYKLDNVVLSGGVALNCIANALIKNLRGVCEVYIPCAPGDDGQSMGNAQYGYYNNTKNLVPRQLRHSFFGRVYTGDVWREHAKKHDLIITKHKDVTRTVAQLLTKGNIIGWFQKNSEFGPRALGHRSILADPRYDFMKDKINARIKFREPFRPFAPSFLYDKQKEYFEDHTIKSWFMSFGTPIKSKMQRFIPAVTHVDGTARLQSVTKHTDKKYYALINEFYKLTKIPCVLNTSFNLNDEPIVETPINAINTFMRCHMDYLVIDDHLLTKPHKDIKDVYEVYVLIRFDDKLLFVRKDKRKDLFVVSGKVRSDETIPHAVVRTVQEQLSLDVFIRARVFEDLVPRKDKIVHKIWFEVDARHKNVIPQTGLQHTLLATKDLKKGLGKTYEDIPVFVRRNSGLLSLNKRKED